MAKVCAEKDIKLVYISTDYVFDGSSPPYKVDATPNPLNKYAETKLAGEKATLKYSQSNAELCLLTETVPMFNKALFY